MGNVIDKVTSGIEENSTVLADGFGFYGRFDRITACTVNSVVLMCRFYSLKEPQTPARVLSVSQSEEESSIHPRG